MSKAQLIKLKLESIFKTVGKHRHGLDSAMRVENYRNWPGPTDQHDQYQANGIIQFDGGHIKYQAVMNIDVIEQKQKKSE